MSCGRAALYVRSVIASGVLFGCLAVPAFAAPAPSLDRADTLLRESIQAPLSVSYVGQLETIRFASSRANATIVKVEHLAPSSTRRWYLAPEALYGDYIITRGSATYDFDTKHSRVTVSHNPALDNQVAAAGATFDRVMTNYRPVLAGSDIIAGRSTTSLVLVNRYTGERVIRVWLDEQTHLVLKKEEYHANGSIASQTRFEDLRYTKHIPDGIFSTGTPAGYQQVTGRDFVMPSADIDKAIRAAGFKPFTPKDLPQGFALTSGDSAVVDGIRTLHLVYSDGLRSISLFENANGAAADFGSLRPQTIRFDNHDAQYVEDGPTTLLTWKEEGLYFALVGDLLRNELVQIAKSIVP